MGITDFNFAKFDIDEIFFDDSYAPFQKVPHEEALVQEIRNLKLNKNSVLIADYRSGTTLTQTIITALLNQGKTIPALARRHSSIHKWSPSLNLTSDPGSIVNSSMNRAKQLLEENQAFSIKTPLPRWLAPEDLSKNKTILVTRNPYDVYSSLYKMSDVNCGQDEFIQSTRNYENDIGCWLDWHNTWASEVKNNKNLKVVFYEELVLNPRQQIKDIAEFLELELSEKHLTSVIMLSRLGNTSEWAEIGASLKNMSNTSIKQLSTDVFNLDPIFKHAEVIKGHLNIDVRNHLSI